MRHLWLLSDCSQWFSTNSLHPQVFPVPREAILLAGRPTPNASSKVLTFKLQSTANVISFLPIFHLLFLLWYCLSPWQRRWKSNTCLFLSFTVKELRLREKKGTQRMCKTKEHLLTYPLLFAVCHRHLKRQLLHDQHMVCYHSHYGGMNDCNGPLEVPKSLNNLTKSIQYNSRFSLAK